MLCASYLLCWSMRNPGVFVWPLLIISRTYGLFRASLRISHFGTNQSTIHTKTLNPKYSTQILLSIDRMQMSIFLQKVKEALFGARCWYKQAKSSNFNGLQDNRYLEVRLHGPNESISKRRKSHLLYQQDCTYKYIWDGLKKNYVN